MGQLFVHNIFLKELDTNNDSKESELYKGTLVKIFKSSARLYDLINNSIFKLWIDKNLMINIIQENYFRSKS